MSTDFSKIKGIAGFIPARLVDGETGRRLACEDGSVRFDPEAANAADTDAICAKNAALACKNASLGMARIRMKRVESTPRL